MNAVIGLCHFCEAHGPCPLFCTFTTEDEKHVTEASISSAQCAGCTSIGPETVYVTRDEGIVYCSRESVPNTELSAFLKQSAIRSITCEVSWNKDGGIVYFNDVRGHVLSFTFQLRDTRARGLKRWFSIIVLMKDRMLLLGLTTMFYEKMKIISKELQDLSEIVFNKEQDVCSQRALRLQTGRNDFGPSRCLSQLTGEGHIFKKLHGYFTGMLKVGGITYKETSYKSQDLIKRLDASSMNASIFAPNACKVDTEGCMPLRSLEGLLNRTMFRISLYCTLTGIDILIISNYSESGIIAKTLSNLLPHNRRNKPKIHLATESIIPAASKCVLEEVENRKYVCKWPGTLPAKCPTLMNKIENAIDETKFDNDILNQHIKYLQLEWLGIARAVKSAIEASSKNSEPVIKLKEVFGVTAQDDLLLNYWIEEFCM